MLLEKCLLVDDQDRTICKINIEFDRTIKTYDQNTVVMRDSIKEHTIMQVADATISYLIDNAHLYDSLGGLFKFAFPLYGGAILSIQFEDNNMDDMLYFTLRYQVALHICGIVRMYWLERFKREEQRNEAIKKIGRISTEINNSYEAALEQIEGGGEIPTGYISLSGIIN